MYDVRIINGLIWIDGDFRRTNVYVMGQKIACLSAALYDSYETIDALNQYVIPGIIDPHVHFALGSGERRSKDDFLTGSACAIHGGVTTIIDFLDPASNAEELGKNYHSRLKQAKDCLVDYKFHATIKAPNDSLEDFVFKMEQLGLSTLKLFTTYSDSNRKTDDESIKSLLKLSKTHPFTLLAHIENDQMIDLNPDFPYQLLNLSRPSLAEAEEAMKLAGFVKQTGGKLYMVHCSSGTTLAKLIHKYPELINHKMFIESCPHYFEFTEDALKRSDGYLYTMAPPLRSVSEQAKLIEHIEDIDCIGTDHCSYDIALKHRNLLCDIPLGIGGVEHAFTVLYSRFGDKIIDKMTINVAKIHGLSAKGRIKEGFDADFAIFEKCPPYNIMTSHTAADNDVYLGMRVTTKVQRTILRGKTIMNGNELLPSQGLLLKGDL